MLLGRAAGLTEDKLAHLGDEVLPDGVYEPAEAAIVRYAQRSTRMEVIGDDVYAALAEHFSAEQIIELCLTVGTANMVNRFHATFLTELDPDTMEVIAESCPVPFPELPQVDAGETAT